MIRLHLMAKEYGQRPSGIIGLPKRSWEAYQFDLWVRHLGVVWENEQIESNNPIPRGQPPPGKAPRSNSKYVPPSQWGNWSDLPGAKIVKK